MFNFAPPMLRHDSSATLVGSWNFNGTPDGANVNNTPHYLVRSGRQGLSSQYDADPFNQVTVADSTATRFGDKDWSLVFDIYFRDLGVPSSAYFRRLVCKLQTSSATLHEISFFVSRDAGGANSISFAYSTTGSNFFTGGSVGPVVTGQWYRVAVTHTAATKTHRMYLDSATPSSTVTHSVTPTTVAVPFSFQGSNGVSNFDSIRGDYVLNFVRKYDGVLSGAEILGLADTTIESPAITKSTQFTLKNGIFGANCLRLRRGSDSAEQDIQFDSSDVIDLAQVSAFLGGATGYVVTWYNQVSGGSHVTQSTASLQPVLNTSGMLSVNCSSARYLTNAAGSSSAFDTIFILADKVGGVAQYGFSFFYAFGSDSVGAFASTNPANMSFFGGSLGVLNGLRVTSNANYNNFNIGLPLSGVHSTSISVASNAISGLIGVGVDPRVPGSRFWNGSVSEICCYSGTGREVFEASLLAPYGL